jgi:hypothetical protein
MFKGIKILKMIKLPRNPMIHFVRLKNSTRNEFPHRRALRRMFVFVPGVLRNKTQMVKKKKIK